MSSIERGIRTKRWIIRGALALAALLLVLGVDAVSKRMDADADAYFEQAMTSAVLSYATCRGINAVVSVMKESSLGATPAGVGVTVGVGQILDPLDDMTERASDVLVIAIACLGLQKIVHEVGGGISLLLPAIAAAALLLLCFARPLVIRRLAAKSLSAVAVLVLIRLLLPISGAVTSAVHEAHFAPKMADASQRLDVIPQERFDALASFDPPRVDGIMDGFEKIAGYLAVKAALVRGIFAEMVDKSVPLVEALLDLAVAYIGLLVLQGVVIPLAVLFTAYWVFRWLMSLRLDEVLGQLQPAQVAVEATPPAPTPVDAD